MIRPAVVAAMDAKLNDTELAELTSEDVDDVDDVDGTPEVALPVPVALPPDVLEISPLVEPLVAVSDEADEVVEVNGLVVLVDGLVELVELVEPVEVLVVEVLVVVEEVDVSLPVLDVLVLKVLVPDDVLLPDVKSPVVVLPGAVPLEVVALLSTTKSA